MEWISVKDEKPMEHVSILIAQHVTNDPNWVEYFVAQYWKREKHWVMAVHFPCDFPYVTINRKIKKDDKWTYIDSPLDME